MQHNRDNEPLVFLTGMVAAIDAFLVGIGLWLTCSRPGAMARFVQEDGFLEWVTFLSLLSACFSLLFIHYVKRAHDGLPWISVKSLGMVLIAGAFLFGTLEEISWGQRLFHWRSPGLFSTWNLQQETNLHNLGILGIRINKLLFSDFLFLLIFVHNVVLPIAAAKKRGILHWVEKVGGFLPPLHLVCVYLVAAIAIQAIHYGRQSEYLEAIGGLHYLASILGTYGLGHGMEAPLAVNSVQRRLAARGMGLLLVFLFILSWILALTSG